MCFATDWPWYALVDAEWTVNLSPWSEMEWKIGTKREIQTETEWYFNNCEWKLTFIPFKHLKKKLSGGLKSCYPKLFPCIAQVKPCLRENISETILISASISSTRDTLASKFHQMQPNVHFGHLRISSPSYYSTLLMVLAAIWQSAPCAAMRRWKMSVIPRMHPCFFRTRSFFGWLSSRKQRAPINQCWHLACLWPAARRPLCKDHSLQKTWSSEESDDFIIKSSKFSGCWQCGITCDVTPVHRGSLYLEFYRKTQLKADLYFCIKITV